VEGKKATKHIGSSLPVVVLVGLITTGSIAPDALAQTVVTPSASDLVPAETIEPTLPPLPSPLPEAFPSPVPVLPEPPRPLLETPAPSTTRFRVQQIEVRGSTVLQTEIAALIQPFVNRDVTFEELVELRSQITQLYIDNGYVTSGAFLLNNQDLDRGIVQIQVIEGELEQISISGLTRLNQEYVRSRLSLAATVPLNQNRLERALQLLQLDPLIEQVNAELTAGNSPGRSILQVSLREAPPLNASISGDNYQAASIGSAQASVAVGYNNLLGWGDRLSGQFGITAGLNLYSLSYTIPVNVRDGAIALQFNNSNSRIIEAEFSDFNIRSETQTVSLGFRQPLMRSPNREFAVGLSLDLRQSQTYILNDIPFSFSAGAENGASKVTVLRFSQDWVDRDIRRVLAARSQFSLGLDALDATVNDTGTDGKFLSWLGQFQYVQQMSSRILLLTRINLQLTPDSLLSLERVGIGGVETVRGYPQNQIVTDNGIWGTIEARIAVTSEPNRLQIVPFVDLGRGWNHRTPNPDITTLASIGVGLRWLPMSDLSLRLDYGLPLTNVRSQGNSLQDNGFYFSIRYQPF
jgi:hemolysin activation/secretion protein